jgi:4-hydroxyphenylpyruvate dioxygenase
VTTLVEPVAVPASLLTGWDSLELWVGNARAAAHWLAAGFGFRPIAYAGPETGVRDRASWVMEQGAVRFVVTAPLSGTGLLADHVRRHGDGVHALSFAVDDVEAAFRAAVACGATPVAPPSEQADADGAVVTASVATYGETIHTFTARRHPVFGPGFTSEGLFSVNVGDPTRLETVDHVVGNVEEGRLEDWVSFYETTFGFTQMTHFDRDQISTEFSALRSTVLTNGRGITMPVNEPAQGRRKSQIQEYLDAYVGAGVQHVALATDDIVASVRALRDRGVRFLTPPAAYYADARRRMDGLDADLPWDDLARLGILVDREPAGSGGTAQPAGSGGTAPSDGYLLQVFTETFTDRPTLFLEVIQRHGASGFGEGNFKALFEAIEHEQARRGNL